MIDSADIKPGLYRVFWTTGRSSLAAIGVTSSGGRWMAPLNWVMPSDKPEIWDSVARLVELEELAKED